MKKLLSLFAIASLLILSSSCNKENLKQVKKQLTTSNPKSQSSGGSTSTPAADPNAGHSGGCPHSAAG